MNLFKRKEVKPEIYFCAFCERDFRRVELDGYVRSNIEPTLGVIPRHATKIEANQEVSGKESAAEFRVLVRRASGLAVWQQTYVSCPGEGAEPQKRP